MRFTWTNVTERRFLVLNFGMTCTSLRGLNSNVGLASACRCPSSEWTSAASCPEIHNLPVVHQKIDG